ncbi:hypothetical protein [Micromonospora sp. NBRC 101691]|uniref:hypothetical protein n=1 Tax=Micromonospora sp. NBRC 101691 TaxID=3032198 RepID=UPI0025530F4A|nr:hypothetical protein [Micromonospora sp. NBRC 101691]
MVIDILEDDGRGALRTADWIAPGLTLPLTVTAAGPDGGPVHPKVVTRDGGPGYRRFVISFGCYGRPARISSRDARTPLSSIPLVWLSPSTLPVPDRSPGRVPMIESNCGMSGCRRSTLRRDAAIRVDQGDVTRSSAEASSDWPVSVIRESRCGLPALAAVSNDDGDLAAWGGSGGTPALASGVSMWGMSRSGTAIDMYRLASTR